MFSQNVFKLSRSCLQNKILLRNSSIVAFLDEPFHITRICVKTVVSNYTQRIYLAKFETEEIDQLKPHKLILTVRPNEFEKLPPKCSSCGSILQTSEPLKNGFLVKEKFLESIKQNQLHRLQCVSCFKLRHYNNRLSSPLPNNEIIDQLMHIRSTSSLILYVVDMFDIEGTLMDKVLSYIGKRKRIIIVGNKIDRFPKEHGVKGEVQLERMKDLLKHICFQRGLEGCNFRDICLISAKTGFGLETLVKKISKHREVDMDIYLVGCTNVGKSSLYNLLQNMLNVHMSKRLPPQAIVHYTPVTTVSLLRSDISMRRLWRLQDRLKKGPWEVEKEYSFDGNFLEFLGVNKPELTPELKLIESSNALKEKKVELVDEEELFKEKKQCFIYDTPGVYNSSQLLQFLTVEEMHKLYPELWIVPRTFLLQPGSCLFIGGLARLDYNSISKIESDSANIQLAKSAESIFVTVMMSPSVPCHPTVIESADVKYEKLFVNNVLEVPIGNELRYKEFPRLLPKTYQVIGKNLNINACDLVLHGLGWLSVASVFNTKVELTLHTPNGIGQELREKPLLPFSVRSKEGRGQMYRGHFNRRLYGHTRKRNPEFVQVFHEQNQAVYAWNKKIEEKFVRERALIKEEKRLKQLEEGVVLGKWKTLTEKEEKFKIGSREKQLPS
ncbi:nitric oxide-associated protein 1 isoform X2 [Hydra vulgaris]|uniref:Nitric oxide-associated protein 1 isoform X2 n=1 Tax=Hydra vulgaris TaxID=6087 RepID=A0ABM4BJF3_HYDVU